MSQSIKINDVIISVDENNNVRITGHNKLFFESAGDVDIKGKRVNIEAEDECIVTSKKHLIEKAPRIDLNPDETEEEYLKFRSRI